MPELPEVEITARLLDRALAGAQIESALAPGINALKTIDPPLSQLAGARIRVLVLPARPDAQGGADQQADEEGADYRSDALPRGRETGEPEGGRLDCGHAGRR